MKALKKMNDCDSYQIDLNNGAIGGFIKIFGAFTVSSESFGILVFRITIDISSF
jgi:hypothetical protein